MHLWHDCSSCFARVYTHTSQRLRLTSILTRHNDQARGTAKENKHWFRRPLDIRRVYQSCVVYGIGYCPSQQLPSDRLVRSNAVRGCNNFGTVYATTKLWYKSPGSPEESRMFCYLAPQLKSRTFHSDIMSLLSIIAPRNQDFLSHWIFNISIRADFGFEFVCFFTCFFIPFDLLKPLQGCGM